MHRSVICVCVFLLACAQGAAKSDATTTSGGGAAGGDGGSGVGGGGGMQAVGGISAEGGSGATGGLSCPADYGDCDGEAINGCEVSLASDPQHCGECDNSCPDGLNATGVCLESMCALACSSGFGDCDSRPGCETDLLNDDNNCGMCGEVCAGSCAEGMCGPGLLAGNQNHPTRIEIDSANIYWVNLGTEPNYVDSEVNQVPVAGGSIVSLATAQSTIFGLAVDATDVYWSTNGTSGNSYSDSTIMKAAIGGGSPQVVADTQAAVDLIVEDSTAYWTSRGTPPNFDDGAIYSTPIGGGAPTELAASLADPAWLASDADNLYFVLVSESAIYKVAKTGGTPTQIHSTTEAIRGLHQFGQILYYSLEGKGIETISVNGGAPFKYGKSLSARFMTDDGVDLFWADQAMGPPTGIVHRSTLVMGMVNSPFVTDQDSPWDVAVDTTNVYWANHGSAGTADGSIMFQTK